MKHIEEKAVRLCLENRVTVTWHDGITAGAGIVDGETDTYQVQFSPGGRVCTCRAGQNHRQCSHSLALELQVQREVEVDAVHV